MFKDNLVKMRKMKQMTQEDIAEYRWAVLGIKEEKKNVQG